MSCWVSHLLVQSTKMANKEHQEMLSSLKIKIKHVPIKRHPFTSQDQENESTHRHKMYIMGNCSHALYTLDLTLNMILAEILCHKTEKRLNQDWLTINMQLFRSSIYPLDRWSFQSTDKIRRLHSYSANTYSTDILFVFLLNMYLTTTNDM